MLHIKFFSVDRPGNTLAAGGKAPVTLPVATPVPAKSNQRHFSFEEITVGEQLGRGGFGTVCECFVANQRYALKRFHIQNRNKEAAQESFQSEKSALRLQHRHVVQMYSTYTRDDTHYILMEFVSTTSLQSVVDNEAEMLSYSRRVRFARHIASGLEHVHGQGIVHLDIKPANILLDTSTDECKIADFGCCKPVQTDSQQATSAKSTLNGTYSYRAPELLRGGAASVQADIYSLGICLWQMATRKRPYGEENHQVVIYKVVARNLRPPIPEALQREESHYANMMVRCWDQDRKLRPDASEVFKFFSKL